MIENLSDGLTNPGLSLWRSFDLIRPDLDPNNESLISDQISDVKISSKNKKFRNSFRQQTFFVNKNLLWSTRLFRIIYAVQIIKSSACMFDWCYFAYFTQPTQYVLRQMSFGTNLSLSFTSVHMSKLCILVYFKVYLGMFLHNFN